MAGAKNNMVMWGIGGLVIVLLLVLWYNSQGARAAEGFQGSNAKGASSLFEGYTSDQKKVMLDQLSSQVLDYKNQIAKPATTEEEKQAQAQIQEAVTQLEGALKQNGCM